MRSGGRDNLLRQARLATEETGRQNIDKVVDGSGRNFEAAANALTDRIAAVRLSTKDVLGIDEALGDLPATGLQS